MAVCGTVRYREVSALTKNHVRFIKKSGVINIPYKSDRQRRFFHTKKAKEEGITSETVKEFDKASKGKRLPETKKKSKKKRKN